MLKDRLLTAMQMRSMNQSQLAKLLQVKPQTIQSICAGKTKQPRNISDIAHYLGVNVQWLLSGVQEITNPQKSQKTLPLPLQKEDIPKITVSKSSAHKITEQEDLPIDKNEIGISRIEDNNSQKLMRIKPWSGREFKNEFVVDKNWLAQNSLVAENLLVTLAATNVMQPIIFYNSQILVDTTKQQINDGCIYLFIIDNQIFIRRLYYNTDGNLHAKAEDIAYSVDNPIAIHKLKVVGKIVYVANFV